MFANDLPAETPMFLVERRLRASWSRLVLRLIMRRFVIKRALGMKPCHHCKDSRLMICNTLWHATPVRQTCRGCGRRAKGFTAAVELAEIDARLPALEAAGSAKYLLARRTKVVAEMENQ